MWLSSFNYPDACSSSISTINLPETINAKKAPQVSKVLTASKGARSSNKRRRRKIDSDIDSEKESDEEIIKKSEATSLVGNKKCSDIESDTDEDFAPTSTVPSVAFKSTLIAEYHALPAHAKIVDPKVSCIVFSRKPILSTELTQTEVLDYLEKRFSSCRLISETEKAKIFGDWLLLGSKTSPMTQIIRNLLEQSSDLSMSEQETSIQEALRRAGNLKIATIERNLVVLEKGTSKHLCVFNNFVTDDPLETTIVTYSTASLLKTFRRGYDYPFIELFKTLLLRQVFFIFFIFNFFILYFYFFRFSMRKIAYLSRLRILLSVGLMQKRYVNSFYEI